MKDLKAGVDDPMARDSNLAYMMLKSKAICENITTKKKVDHSFLDFTMCINGGSCKWIATDQDNYNSLTKYFKDKCQ